MSETYRNVKTNILRKIAAIKTGLITTLVGEVLVLGIICHRLKNIFGNDLGMRGTNIKTTFILNKKLQIQKNIFFIICKKRQD